MTILSLASDWGGMPASSVTLLLLKVTAVLCVAIVLDLLLHRRFVLACAAAWNATIVLLIALPLASLLMPGVRLDSESVEHASVSSQPTVATLAPQADMPETVPAGEPAIGPVVSGPASMAPAEPGKTASRVPEPASPAMDLGQAWLLPALVLAYGCGVAIMLIRLFASMVAVLRLRRASQQVDDGAWQAKLTDWRKRCCVPRAVELRQSKAVSVPVVVGYRRPTIIVPEDLVAGTGGMACDAILVHELGHIARRDFGWQFVQRMLGAALWFHPLVWLAHRRIGLIRERVCDEFAVFQLGSGGSYVATLLEMATRLTRRPSPSLGLAVLRSSQLGQRLAAIHNSRGFAACQLGRGPRLAALASALLIAAWVGRSAIADPPAARMPGLPSEAQTLTQSFEEDAASLRAEADRKIAEKRDKLERSLQALQDKYTRQAQLDEALAIREQIRLLRAAKYRNIVPVTIEADATMSNYKTRVGQSFYFTVTGSATGGYVWGTDRYTDDSNVSMAAVHAGALQAGETGVVKVSVLPGLPSYTGTTRNGVASQDWANGEGYVSFSVERAPPELAAAAAAPPVTQPVPMNDPGNMSNYKTCLGQSFYISLVATTTEGVWGTDLYSDDSSVATAAVHAGVLQAGEAGVVKVTMRPGLPFYQGSTRHGVTSGYWQNNNGAYVSFKVERAPKGLGSWLRPNARLSRAYFVPLVRRMSAQGAGSRSPWPGGPGGPGMVGAGGPGMASAGGPAIPETGGPGMASAGGPGMFGTGGPGMPGASAPPAVPIADGDRAMSAFPQSIGKSFIVQVVGSTTGAVWGTDLYTHDSSLDAAAVHAGILQPGEKGIIEVTVLPALAVYHGSTLHGVTSQDWQNDGTYVSLKIERASRNVKAAVPAESTGGGSARWKDLIQQRRGDSSGFKPEKKVEPAGGLPPGSFRIPAPEDAKDR